MKVLTFCLLAAGLAAQNTQPSFENDQVIVNEPHKLNRVVYLHQGCDRSALFGDEARYAAFHGSDDSSISGQETGNPERQNASDALRVDAKHFRPELENSQVRVLRVNRQTTRSVIVEFRS